MTISLTLMTLENHLHLKSIDCVLKPDVYLVEIKAVADKEAEDIKSTRECFYILRLINFEL